MPELWSHTANDVVDVDFDDEQGIEICDECNEEIIEPRFDDGDPFCEECYTDIFGEDN